MSETKVISKIAFFLLMCSVIAQAAHSDSTGETLIYHRSSDASAAAAVAEDMFVVADDENNILRLYKTTQAGPPVFSCDLTEFLDIDAEHPEADIEGATRLGDRIYWITSHGRNRNGKMRPNRYRFFVTQVKIEKNEVNIKPVGTASKTLIDHLLNVESMHHLKLDQATRLDNKNLTKKQRKNLAPKKQGLNIEALCASADGRIIYIGFRNPRQSSKAIVIPLKNPAAVVEKQHPPVFTQPMLWDLDGRGIRSMEYSRYHEQYFIVAGSHDESRYFALYSWSGKEDQQPILVREIFSGKNTFTPEALVTFDNRAELLLISDDGSLPVSISNPSECLAGKSNKGGTCPNKYLADQRKKSFRAVWVTP